jgi:hypothetical protein
LNLTIDEEIVKRAKSYASESGRSLSESVERYLDKITNGSYAVESASVYGKQKWKKEEFKIPEDLKEIVGCISIDFDPVKIEKK